MPLQQLPNYAVGLPDVANPLEMLAQGLDARRKNRELEQKNVLARTIGGHMASGDISGAANAAFTSGDIGTGVDITKLGQEQQNQVRQVVANAIRLADTPEKWSTTIQTLSKRLGPQVAQEYGDFSTRDAALAELGSTDQVDSEITRRDKSRAAPNVISLNGIDNVWDAAQGKFVPQAGGVSDADKASGAPTIAEVYDAATGQPAKVVWDATKKQYVPIGGVKSVADGKAPPVIEIYDPQTGRPQKAQWDETAGAYVPIGGVEAPKKGGGIRTTVNPDGSVTTEIGGDSGMTQSTQNKVGEKQLNAAETGSRLAGIMTDFKPEYQTLYGKAINAKRSWQAWLDPSSLSTGDKQELASFAQYRSKAFSNLSQFLNDLSGAAISPAEFGRLSQAMPNPGTGIFDGDDPVTFKSKMETVASEAQRALARYQFYQQTGSIPASLDAIPLNDVKKVGDKWYVKKDGKVFEIGASDAAQP